MVLRLVRGFKGRGFEHTWNTRLDRLDDLLAELQNGVPVVTDGPYAETQEVLAGYWVVDCDSFDRATEIAARLFACPEAEDVRARAVVDVRPIDNAGGPDTEI